MYSSHVVEEAEHGPVEDEHGLAEPAKVNTPLFVGSSQGFNRSAFVVPFDVQW